jgi:GTP pyrophosphokinase
VETRTIDDLVAKIKTYNPDANFERITRAYELANNAHGPQQRSTGDPYITHCLAVAGTLADMYLDEDTIVAALLHDVPEDTTITIDTIREQFGEDVALRVDGVTKLSKLQFGMKETEAESLRKMFIAMAEEIRVVLIKLADRLHNMRTLYALSPAKQIRIARETMEIYAPLANRFGIYNIRRELEDLSFQYLNPDKYKELDALLAQDRDDQQKYIDQAKTILIDQLAKENLRPLEMSGRPKHIYSIFVKMQRKQRDFAQIHDLRAIRVIMESVRDCYVVLGIVHSIWTPIPGEFDDYIARPKDNLYQSLHTAVIGPEGQSLEIQIRTLEMHRTAEYGIASHWRYKEPGARHNAAFEDKINWMRQLMEWRKDIADAKVFVDSLKTDIFQDQVYVFTPKGKIIEMPTGATPIDFAYHIHTEVGNRCRGAKVNGRIVPLDHVLHTGDRIEILTAKKGGPSRDWLNPGLGLVNTSRGREKIRQWFKHQERTEAIAEGREVLEKELRRLGMAQSNYEEIAKLFNFKMPDDFLEALGHADISIQSVSIKLLEAERPKEIEPEIPTARPAPKLPETPVTIKGVGNLLQRLANCCHPLPGDDVVGFITRGRGITIHRRDCRNVLEAHERDRIISIDWNQTVQSVYPVQVQVRAIDRSGLVHDISGVVAAEGINMAAAHALAGRKDGISIITTTLEISSADQLTRILNKIDRLPNVLEVRRLTNEGD